MLDSAAVTYRDLTAHAYQAPLQALFMRPALIAHDFGDMILGNFGQILNRCCRENARQFFIWPLWCSVILLGRSDKYIHLAMSSCCRPQSKSRANCTLLWEDKLSRILKMSLCVFNRRISAYRRYSHIKSHCPHWHWH